LRVVKHLPVAALLMLVACTHRETPKANAPDASAPAASASAVAIASASGVPTSSPAPVASASPCASLTAELSLPAATVDAGMWGESIGDSFGAGGLGTNTVRDAGRPPTEVIGIGRVTGSGHGTGTLQGFGNGRGQLGGGHHVNAPRVRLGNMTVSGGLASVVIQRIVRQSFGRFRLCYETGRQKDSKLGGAVVTRFIIDAKGAVSKAEPDPCTTMPDADVTSCVVRGLSALKFPPADDGDTSVVFPLLFSPSE